MESNFESFEMQKLNIQMNRAQRVDEKNSVIFLFIMFTPRIMGIRMSKNRSYFVFSVDNSKISVRVE